MENEQLAKSLPKTAFAFRGYNVTNLGRTPELLEHPAYGKIVAEKLIEGSQIATQVLGRDVDLVQRVRAKEETTLESYADAVAMIVAVEQAQLSLLNEFHETDFKQARTALGFSLGEISALVASGVFEMDQALKIPLSMSSDGVELAQDMTLAVMFSRREEIPLELVQEHCTRINAEGKGTIGISTHISPNSVLLMGTEDTIDRLKKHIAEVLPQRIILRKNPNKWPPLHTPIVWKKNIVDRSADMMHTLRGGFDPPTPPILSLVTGKESYNGINTRQIMRKWIDETQMLWDAIYELLSMGIETIVHVGPEPNIIPSTFERLAVDVEAQTKGSFHMKALSTVIRRPWISSVLPKRAALLRAPQIRQVVLEDWLLENAPS